MKTILLLTATIAPAADVPDLAVIDPQARLRQYLDALDFYIDQLGNSVDAIVFAENSGASLAAVEALAERRGGGLVEVIGLKQAAAGAKGRGCAEFALIEEAVERSRMILEAPECRVWKISGRYIVTNLDEVLRSMRPGREFYCNCRDWPRRWADMFLIGWTATGFARLIRGMAPALDESRTGLPPEIVWRAHVDNAARALPIQRRFRRVPELKGIRGYDAADYSGWKYRLRTRLRSAAARFVPFLWI